MRGHRRQKTSRPSSCPRPQTDLSILSSDKVAHSNIAQLARACRRYARCAVAARVSCSSSTSEGVAHALTIFVT